MKASLFDDTAQGLLAHLNFFWHEKKIWTRKSVELSRTVQIHWNLQSFLEGKHRPKKEDSGT